MIRLVMIIFARYTLLNKCMRPSVFFFSCFRIFHISQKSGSCALLSFIGKNLVKHWGFFLLQFFYIFIVIFCSRYDIVSYAPFHHLMWLLIPFRLRITKGFFFYQTLLFLCAHLFNYAASITHSYIYILSVYTSAYILCVRSRANLCLFVVHFDAVPDIVVVGSRVYVCNISYIL